jgi:hypothetical protein
MILTALCRWGRATASSSSGRNTRARPASWSARSRWRAGPGFLGQTSWAAGLTLTRRSPQRRSLHLRRGHGPAQRPDGQTPQPLQPPPYPTESGSGGSRPCRTMSKPWPACRTSSATAGVVQEPGPDRDRRGHQDLLRQRQGPRPGATNCPWACRSARSSKPMPAACCRAPDVQGLPAGRGLHALHAAGALRRPDGLRIPQKAGHRLGTAAIMVFDHKTCLVAATLNLITFFARESCGWCTPCREGLPYIRDLLVADRGRPGRTRIHPMLSAWASTSGSPIAPLRPARPRPWRAC